MGAPLETFNSKVIGAAYVYALVGSTWTQQAEAIGSDSLSNDSLGPVDQSFGIAAEINP